MDANRFDTLAKELTGTRSRRSALGAAIAGGVLSALGLGRESPALAAQDDRCEVPGAGGTCVLDFEAILREGPSMTQPLVPGGSPGRLRGYLMFTRGRAGDLEDSRLFLDDGSSLPVSGLAIGQGFQARIEVGRGQALVAVGVGEPDFTRCLGRLDGTVTSTVVGDLGEWHALAGVQNIPSASGGSTQSTGSGSRPASAGSGSGLQLAQGNAPNGSRSNGATGGSGNPPVAASSGNQAGSNASGSGNGSSGASGGNGSTDSDRPANGSGSRGSDGQAIGDRDTVEERQETDGEAILACPESQTRCGSNCVNLQTDASNCGQCGNACARSEDCRDGICSAGDVTCQEGETRCSNTCVNTTSDVFNCGECGTVCALDEECTGGQCRAIEADGGDDEDEADDADDPEACEQDQTRCGATCTDLQTDEINCGACGTTCAAGEGCVAGKCTPPASPLCPEGQVRCDGVCKEALPNFGSEGISCPGGGAAPTECPAGRFLCNGACFPEGQCQPTDCAPGWGYCYGVCRDLQTDPGACGTCGTSCPGGICLNGSCLTCPEGHMPCNGSCVNVQGDPEHCGFCNNRCGTQCINGECTGVGPTPGCAPGTTRCGNACVDLTRDSTNCGACGNVCGANSTCYPPGEGGFSAAYCESIGDQACGLGCVPRSDPFNCGGCGNVCPGGYACDPDLEICYIIGGSKRDGVKPTPRQSLAPSSQQTLVPASDITCPPEQDACAGVCTDLSTDARNCGACGNACAADEDCLQGQCAASGSPTVGTSAEPVAAGPLPDADAPGSETTSETPGAPCAEGQVTCGGVCTDLAVDPLNCGDCGVNCGAGGTCDFGVCSAPPRPRLKTVRCQTRRPWSPPRLWSRPTVDLTWSPYWSLSRKQSRPKPNPRQARSPSQPGALARLCLGAAKIATAPVRPGPGVLRLHPGFRDRPTSAVAMSPEYGDPGLAAARDLTIDLSNPWQPEVSAATAKKGHTMTQHVLFIQGAGNGAYDEDTLLVDSLQTHLGQGFEVHYPRMPNEDDAPYEQWRQVIEDELAGLPGSVVVAGHSVGASVLAKWMSARQDERPIAGLFLAACPYWGGDGWRYEGYKELELRAEPGDTINAGIPIYLYHCRDDEVVPFDHLALWKRDLPQATVRVLATGGHQFNNDLSVVARDIASAIG